MLFLRIYSLQGLHYTVDIDLGFANRASNFLRIFHRIDYSMTKTVKPILGDVSADASDYHSISPLAARALLLQRSASSLEP